MSITLAEMLVKIGIEDDVDSGLDGISNKFERLGSTLTKVGAGMTAAITGPLLGVGAAVLSAWGDVDDAMDRIRVGTGATGDALQGLRGSFEAVFTSVPVSAEQASTAIADLNTRLGLTGDPLETMATQFLNLARITGSDVAPMIQNATRLFGDWSVQGSTVAESAQMQGEAMDYLFRVTQTTGIGFERLTGLVVQFGAPLRALGFDLEQSAALLGKWEKEGVNMETVLAGMRMGLKNFAAAGVDPAEGLRSTIDAIKAARTETEATAIAFEVFGQRAGVDMARAIQEGRFEIDGLVTSLKNSGETINKAAADTLDFGEQWTLLKNKMTMALEPLGAALAKAFGGILDHVQPAIDMVKSLAEGFSGLSPSTQTFILAVGGIAAAIGPVLVGLGLMAQGIGALAPMFAPVAAGAASLAGALGASGGLAAILPVLAPLAIAFGAAIAGWALYEAATELSRVNSELSRMYDLQERGIQATKGQAQSIGTLEAAIASHNRTLGNKKIDLPSMNGKTPEQYLKDLQAAGGKLPKFEGYGIEDLLVGGAAPSGAKPPAGSLPRPPSVTPKAEKIAPPPKFDTSTLGLEAVAEIEYATAKHRALAEEIKNIHKTQLEWRDLQADLALIASGVTTGVSDQALAFARLKAEVEGGTLAVFDMKTVLKGVDTSILNQVGMEELNAALARPPEAIKATTEAIANQGKVLKEQVSPVVREIQYAWDAMDRSIADSIVNFDSWKGLWSDLKDVAIGTLKDIGSSILTDVVGNLKDKIVGIFTGKDGKGGLFSGIFDGIGGIFSGGGSGGGGGGGGIGGEITQRMQNYSNPITAAMQAAGDIMQGIGALTGSWKEDIARTEVSTRGMLNQLISLQESANEYWPSMQHSHEALVQFLDGHAWRIHDVWEVLGEIRDSIFQFVNTLSSVISGGKGGGDVIQISEEAFGVLVDAVSTGADRIIETLKTIQLTAVISDEEFALRFPDGLPVSGMQDLTSITAEVGAEMTAQVEALQTEIAALKTEISQMGTEQTTTDYTAAARSIIKDAIAGITGHGIFDNAASDLERNIDVNELARQLQNRDRLISQGAPYDAIQKVAEQTGNGLIGLFGKMAGGLIPHGDFAPGSKFDRPEYQTPSTPLTSSAIGKLDPTGIIAVMQGVNQSVEMVRLTLIEQVDRLIGFWGDGGARVLTENREDTQAVQNIETAAVQTAQAQTESVSGLYQVATNVQQGFVSMTEVVKEAIAAPAQYVASAFEAMEGMARFAFADGSAVTGKGWWEHDSTGGVSAGMARFEWPPIHVTTQIDGRNVAIAIAEHIEGQGTR